MKNYEGHVITVENKTNEKDYWVGGSYLIVSQYGSVVEAVSLDSPCTGNRTFNLIMYNVISDSGYSQKAIDNVISRMKEDIRRQAWVDSALSRAEVYVKTLQKLSEEPDELPQKKVTVGIKRIFEYDREVYVDTDTRTIFTISVQPFVKNVTRTSKDTFIIEVDSRYDFDEVVAYLKSL